MNRNEEVKILCVDDEKNVLKSLKRHFLDFNYEILTASSGDDGLAILEKTNPVQIVISDYRMPGMNGVDFLKVVYKHWPDTVRIVLSGYADTAVIIGAINEGHIYKFIPKPWNDDDLKVTISNTLDRYFIHKKNIQLTRELREKNEELKMINDNLEKIVEKRTTDLIMHNKVLVRSQNILDSLPVGVMGVDPEGQIVQCNKKVSKLLGIKNEDMIGTDRKETLPDEINRFIESVKVEQLISGQIDNKGSDIRMTGVYMKHPPGQEGIILIFDEVTEGV